MPSPKSFVLLVEDNPDDELLTIRAFQKNKIANQIVVVRDGREALDFLFCQNQYADRDIKSTPQVILLDIKLPKINGLEVLKEIRSRPETEFLPVVILTSSKEERDVFESYQLGANSYIRKPVDFNQFQECVRELGLYWLVFNQKAEKN
jgi:CheY-like chemotaxis protein